ncbi:MAG: TolC family protein [Spirochaetes bacterium]|nr:TolC family protein [Spirochaetota bacterium]
MRYAAILLIALHCRSAPVTLGDNKIEPVYEQILRESSVKKRLADIDFNARNFTIEELFVLSLDRTEQLAIAAERTTIADATVRRSYGAWLPRLSVTAAQYAPLTPGFVVPGVRFTARQNIMTGLTEYGNVVGARLTRVAEEQNLRAEMSAHLLNVADAVLQLKLNHELTEQTAEAVRLTQSNLAEIRRRVSIGRNKRGDALKAEARLRQKQADLLAAEEREAQLKRYLVFLTGVLGEFSVNADTAPFTRDLTGKEEADISRRADIALGKTMLDLRKNELLAAHGGHLPNIYLDGSYRPALDASQTTSYFGGVVAEVPFFQGGQVVENQNIAASRVRQAELELKRAERKARTELEDAREAYLKAAGERTAYTESADAAEKNYRAQLSDLRLSLATTLDVIQAMEDLQLARASRASAEYREAIARMRYFVALGFLFPEPKR